MILGMIALGIIVLLLSLELLRMKRQLKEWARQLEETDETSNLRLGAQVRLHCFVRLARAVNTRLEKGQQARIRQETVSRELKHTISCVSHDIRTPLMGASGYLQLLETSSDPKEQKMYLTIIRHRLRDLEELLEELFLYTKLANEEYHMELEAVPPYAIVCDVLAGFYEKLTEAQIEPQLSFPQPPVSVYASAPALSRIFHNLIKNALLYGRGSLIIRQEGSSLSFTNAAAQPQLTDASRLFEPFYRTDSSRHSPGAGLGLASVKGLMEKMGGSVSAGLNGSQLTITLHFKKP